MKAEVAVTIILFAVICFALFQALSLSSGALSPHLSPDRAPAYRLRATGLCSASEVLVPVRRRSELGAELKRLGFTGGGVELGVQQGVFTQTLLSGWQQAEVYVQVDLWQAQDGTAERQLQYMRDSMVRAQQMKEQGFVKSVWQCQNFTTACAEHFGDGSLDFVYVASRDAGMLEDLAAYWPKLRAGGVMAGHNVEQAEIQTWEENNISDDWHQDWTLNVDGTVDSTGRAVKGAVERFFSGEQGSPTDLHRCPRQLTITYEESMWNSWIVRKPAGPPMCKPQAVLPPVRHSKDLGALLRNLGFSGAAMELGAQDATFAAQLLPAWGHAGDYVLVGQAQDEGTAAQASAALHGLVAQGFADAARQCVRVATECAEEITEASLDFVFVNARGGRGVDRAEQYRSLLADVSIYWPKLRTGGIMVGSNFDGPKDSIGRVVRGLVTSFFGGRIAAPDDLKACPRQVTVTYQDSGPDVFWLVRK